MQQIFVYEHLTGGGKLGQDLPPQSLLREGQAMVTALAADFAALPDVAVTITRDARQEGISIPNCRVLKESSAPEAATRFLDLAAESDWTVLIAPEFDGILLERCRMVETVGRLLGSLSAMVELASDKHATVQWLHSHGIPAPKGIRLQAGGTLPSDFRYPAVLKPIDGAGSMNVERIERANAPLVRVTEPSCLEVYHAGTPASVAVISGTKGRCILRPCRQRLSDDGKFSYLGGELPLPEMDARARWLAERVADALPEALGYWGIDLVLGADAASDVVIEINPRLTTSYVGLRAAAKGNLAQAMLRLAGGDHVEIDYHDERIAFDAAGKVWRQRGAR